MSQRLANILRQRYMKVMRSLCAFSVYVRIRDGFEFYSDRIVSTRIQKVNFTTAISALAIISLYEFNNNMFLIKHREGRRF